MKEWKNEEIRSERIKSDLSLVTGADKKCENICFLILYIIEELGEKLLPQSHPLPVEFISPKVTEYLFLDLDRSIRIWSGQNSPSSIISTKQPI